MRGQFEDAESTKSPGRARIQRVLQEGICREVTVCGLQVTWGGGWRDGWSAREKNSGNNSDNNGCHWFLFYEGSYTLLAYFQSSSNPCKVRIFIPILFSLKTIYRIDAL